MKYKIISGLLLLLFIGVSITLYETDRKYSILKKNIKNKEILIQDQLSYINKNNIDHELKIKNRSDDIIFRKQKVEKLQIFKKSFQFTTYKNQNQFVRGINNYFPGSGFLQTYNNHLFVISAVGIIAFKGIGDDEDLSLKQIDNNINSFVSKSELEKDNWFSIKDLLVYDNKIFISFTNEYKKDCWNTSIVYAKLNFDKLIFEPFFVPEECVKSKGNIDNEFNAHQSGGRMVAWGKNILLSTGDFRLRNHAQRKDTVFGKIIKINLDNSKNKFEVISLGHRNPQGLLIDEKENFILSTEHGPHGGDEINLNLKPLQDIKNFGWPISSYGEHYGGKDSLKNKEKYIKYPLYKSHKNHGFVEPIHYFVPSIGISEIIKVNNKNYIVSSLKDKSIYSFQINDGKINNLKRIEIGERVRDMFFDKKRSKIYLFLEDTASIGIINFERS